MGCSESRIHYCGCGNEYLTDASHYHIAGVCGHRGKSLSHPEGNNICIVCSHTHQHINCCLTRHDKEIIEEVKIPIGSKTVEVIEDKVIGSKKVMKNVEEKIPYQATRQVQQTRYNRIAETKYKTEYYTEYEARTESYYSQYQGMNGNISYRTNYYPVQRTRQVSYTDYVNQPETYYTTETYTDYNIKLVYKEVDEPIIEKIKVDKIETIYEVKKITKIVGDVICECHAQQGCRCWRPTLLERIFFGDENCAQLHECTTYPCKHSSFMARVKARSMELEQIYKSKQSAYACNKETTPIVLQCVEENYPYSKRYPCC